MKTQFAGGIIKISFDINGSLTSHTGNLGCTCAHIFKKKTWGALIGAGVLNRANTVLTHGGGFS